DGGDEASAPAPGEEDDSDRWRRLRSRADVGRRQSTAPADRRAVPRASAPRRPPRPRATDGRADRSRACASRSQARRESPRAPARAPRLRPRLGPRREPAGATCLVNLERDSRARSVEREAYVTE